MLSVNSTTEKVKEKEKCKHYLEHTDRQIYFLKRCLTTQQKGELKIRRENVEKKLKSNKYTWR